MRSIPPHRTGRLGRRLVLITLTALIAFPTFSIGVPDGMESNQDERIRNLVRDAQVQVRDLQGNLKFELRDGVPNVVPEDNFSQTVTDIGFNIHETFIAHNYIRKHLLWNVKNELSTFSPNLQDRNQLVGRGGCVDRALEAYFWDEPAGFTKGLVETAQGVKFKVEYLFDMDDHEDGKQGEKFLTSPVFMSAVANPRLRFKPIFTYGMYGWKSGATGDVEVQNGYEGGDGGGWGSRPQIDFVVGGAVTHPLTGEFKGCAGVFGTGAAPGSSIDVFSVGNGWDLSQTVTADSSGAFQATFEGIQPGIGLYSIRSSTVMADSAAQAAVESYDGGGYGSTSKVEMALQLGRQPAL
jgi:hypothetical protein